MLASKFGACFGTFGQGGNTTERRETRDQRRAKSPLSQPKAPGEPAQRASKGFSDRTGCLSRFSVRSRDSRLALSSPVALLLLLIAVLAAISGLVVLDAL